jgi:hypothetical protein
MGPWSAGGKSPGICANTHAEHERTGDGFQPRLTPGVQAVLDASGSPYDISEEIASRRMEREGVVLTAT